jgi:hypothetical protein
MPFGVGSRSAQTPNESIQQSRSNRVGGPAHAVAGLDDNTQYRVYHKWRKCGQVEQRGTPHHSQIFITDMNGNEVCNFGLFQNNGVVVYGDDVDDPMVPYHVSSSYKPNPIVRTGLQIQQAVAATVVQCGPDYDLLYNNCQKFGRLFMTALGAAHSREFFHP